MRMGVELPDADGARKLLLSLAQPTGGFLENRYSKRPGTNGCAAAIALCVMLELELETDPHAAYVAGMFSGEGGFHATPAAPIADLLSTYTALLTLKMLGKLDPRFVNGALRYARGLEHADGGYAGFALRRGLSTLEIFCAFYRSWAWKASACRWRSVALGLLAPARPTRIGMMSRPPKREISTIHITGHTSGRGPRHAAGRSVVHLRTRGARARPRQLGADAATQPLR